MSSIFLKSLFQSVILCAIFQFEKPGARDIDYPDMAKEAGAVDEPCSNVQHIVSQKYECFWFTGQKALADAGVKYSAVQQACVGYVYGMLYLLSVFNII